ncbi:hypothetical protein H2204_013261 [Knufia peltigerae]|uniref:Uncharacterized protein n=1 Tax=Knufia peltigerae TaxID=1002370 RepID=A0AA38XQW0_9EURO|nr:hypothetical protein H2204_013261 [Knufia peltigerae]
MTNVTPIVALASAVGDGAKQQPLRFIDETGITQAQYSEPHAHKDQDLPEWDPGIDSGPPTVKDSATTTYLGVQPDHDVVGQHQLCRETSLESAGIEAITSPRPGSDGSNNHGGSPISPSISLRTHAVTTLETGTAVSSEGEEGSYLLRAMLMRHFIDHLAGWFDLIDPERYFACTVPERAKTSAQLMNTVLCVSATHLLCLPYEQRARHISRPALINDDVAIYYHNESIRPFMALTTDSTDIHDENLLAATVLLRWHEEIDAPRRADDEDRDLFLRVKNLLVTEQFQQVGSPMLHGTSAPAQQSWTISGMTTDDGPGLRLSPGFSRGIRPHNLREASFWIAFRQEIYTCFLKEQRFELSLSNCSAFRSFDPAEDTVWANRLIVFCADCLEFCYSSVECQTGRTATPNILNSPMMATTARWAALKQQAEQWAASLPSSFDPIYYSPARDHPPWSNIFPELWYRSDCHVIGLQHLGIAQILLTVHDPTQPKLGPAVATSARQISQSVRMIVKKLCGMALGNPRIPPATGLAGLAIARAGGHFENRREQEALLGMLDVLRVEHGWTIGNTVEDLKAYWGTAIRYATDRE